MIGQTLGHYELVEKIGAGGMGEVYRAHDRHLERDVALKILPAGVLANESARKRFRHEALALSKLNHPNIATVFDFSTQDNIDFLAMELICGESLGTRVKDGPLPVAEVFRLGIQLAEGLAAAHAQDLIHRDLKPGNLMVTSDGRLKILDFGLAVLVRPEGDVDAPRSVTASADLLGTLPYMSPEQLSGLPVDGRSDIYAAGAVLYEIATGQRPFPQLQAAELICAILHHSPVAPSTQNIGVTPALERVVLKALDKDPANRFQSALELFKSLQELGAAVALPPQKRLGGPVAMSAGAALLAVLLFGLAIGANVGGMRDQLFPGHNAESAAGTTASATSPQRRSIAVLGFKNLSGREDEAWLSTALSEMFTTELGAGEKVRTVPSETVARMKVDLALVDAESYAPQTLKHIGKNLGTDYVLTGSYLALGKDSSGKIRVDLRLQETAAGETLQSVSESGTESEVSDLVVRVGLNLRKKLGLGSVSANDVASVRASLPSNPRATRLYSEGLAKLRVFDALAARDLFENAIEADRNFPLAHSALAAAWSAVGYDAKAQAEAKKAFDLSSNLSPQERQWVAGLYWEMSKDWDRAAEVYGQLFKASPDNIEYGLRLAAALTEGGKGKEALNTVEMLKKIPPPGSDDPRIDLAEERAANSLSDLKREQEAATRAAEKAELRGARLVVGEARQHQGWALRNLGEPKKALEVLAQAKKIFIETNNPFGVAGVLLNAGAAQWDLGDITTATTTWRQALAISRKTGNKQVEASALNNLAILMLQEGDLAGARATNEQALELRTAIADRNGVSFSLLNLANTLMAQGDLGGTQKRMQDALAVAREVGNRKIEATALLNIGIVSIAQGDLQRAQKMYDEAQKIFEETKVKVGVATAMKSRGEALKLAGDLGSATKILQEALHIFKEIEDKAAVVDTCLDLADLLIEEGRPAGAEQTLREARKEYRSEKRLDTEIQADAALIRAFLGQGKLNEAQQAASVQKQETSSTP